MAKEKPRSNSLAITVIAALVVLIYIGAGFVQFLTQTSMSYMIAREGEMEVSFTLQGAITRKETLVTASSDGVVQYYYPGGKRLANKVKVGVMMDSYYGGLLEEKLQEIYLLLEETDTEYTEVFEQIRADLSDTVAAYMRDKDHSQYDSIYALKEDVETYMARRRELFALSNNTTVMGLLEQEGVYLTEKETEETNLWLTEPGTIMYSYDGYEGWTADQITADFCRNYSGGYTQMNVQMQQRQKGDPLYRLITSETWNVTTYLTEEQAKQMSGKKTVDFLINETTPMTAEIIELIEAEDGGYRMILEFGSHVLEYAETRVVSLKYVEESIDGIKVSDQCVVKKTFYGVPSSYLVASGNRRGVMKVTEDGVSFVRVSVVYTEGEMVYFDLPSGLQARDTIQAEGSRETLRIAETKELDGVYIVNGGNENFTVVDVLHKEQGYIIIKGISLYDRVLIVGE